MTETQAWTEIADAYATPRGERFGVAIALFGICSSIDQLFGEGRIGVEVRDILSHGVSTDVALYQAEGWGYYFNDPDDPANDILRADYCYLQAEIAKTGGV